MAPNPRAVTSGPLRPSLRVGSWGGAIVVDGIVRCGLVKVAMGDGRCGMESSLKQALLTSYTPSSSFFQDRVT